MDNTIFFGNGINLVAGGKSWDDILKDMSFRDSLPAISSNTLKYEYIILQKPYKQFVPLLLKGSPLLLAGKIYGEFFNTENGVVKRKLCDKLIKQPYNSYYTELFKLNTQNYVTTNYELFLNNEFESHGFSHKKNSGNTSRLYVPQTRRTAKEAIHRKGAVESHKGYWFYCRPSEDNQRFH